MCDTLVAIGNATADGSVILAKNSDREPNETQEVVVLPRTRQTSGTLRCTYLEIPQVEETFAVLLSKPVWMWGAEMGANEHGVVIGNEAVFTRIPYEKGPALTGMDLLRLALERADSAQAALTTITTLLERYGQGGNCGYTHGFYYHNGFLIADPAEAWVLETAGKHWAAQRVTGVRSISNAISIGSEFDMASPQLVEYAMQRGWCKRKEDFDFARCYSDFLFTRFSDAMPRQCRSMDMLQKSGSPAITPARMMNYLRDHGPDAKPDQGLRQGLMGADICMHAGYGPIRNSQTTGSLVSHLSSNGHTHWVTATAAPCTGIFKPVWIEAGQPDFGPQPPKTYDPASLWWRHEVLHRSVLQDYASRMPLYRQERDDLEQRFIDGEVSCRSLDAAGKAAYTARCSASADEAAARWTEMVRSSPVRRRTAALYRQAWRQFNQAAQIDGQV